ncbi:MAG: hypothetical protein HY084_01625 [Gemmatimonadetes bacterium]|nr:hypothetical protein [Gemmatimonadota bacterium]
MQKPLLAAFALAMAVTPLAAQEDAIGRCVSPDSIAVTGNKRIPSTTILLDAGLAPHTPLNAPAVQRAIRNVFAAGQFEGDIAITCTVKEGTPPVAIFTIKVRERPVLDFVDVAGTKNVATSDVRGVVDLLIGRPIDPSQVARAVQRIDSIYQGNGFTLARITPETTFVADNHASLVFRIDEGRRLAISGIRVRGNTAVDAKSIAKAMQTKPEGFWFWQKGEFDQDKYARDVGDSVPAMFLDRGYIDFQLLKDTIIVDRDRGKGLIDLSVSEGKQYKVGAFEVTGSRRFSSADIARFYPFNNTSPTLQERLKSLLKRKPVVKNVFDQSEWDDATSKVRQAYATEGYIYAQVRPILDRQHGPDGDKVNLRWDVQEGSPAIVNRIEIIGNDYTHENCIRDQLVIIPGGVFNQDALIRSWRSVQNLGFFEQMNPPETRQANDQGDVDVIFKVKEKRTGNVNFGASMGQGTGLGGFIGLDQPNLFGLCKRGQINWQYGQYINDFQTLRKRRAPGDGDGEQLLRMSAVDLRRRPHARHAHRAAVPDRRHAAEHHRGIQRRPARRHRLVPAVQDGVQVVHDARQVRRRQARQFAHQDRGRDLAARRVPLRRSGPVLRLAVVLARRRAVRRAVARLPRVLDHAVRLQRRDEPDERDAGVVRQHVLHDDRRGRRAVQRAVLRRHVLRRRQPLVAAA